MLRIFLFGAPYVEDGGQIVPLRRTKALALLAYLALTRQPQDRDTLLGLLWPEFDDASARNNLRRELSLLKAALPDQLLVADRLQITWNPQAPYRLDVAEFQEQIAIYRQHCRASGDLCAACAEALAAAVRLAGGEFMAGFHLPDRPAFEEWQFFQREELRQQLAEALQALISWHGRAEALNTAIDYARRWLALDPLHEPAQRALIRLYAQAGQQSAALRQYAECLRLLDEELGLEPEPATIELHAQIRSRVFVKGDGGRGQGIGDWGLGVRDSLKEAPQSPISNRPVTSSLHHPITPLSRPIYSRTPLHPAAGSTGRLIPPRCSMTQD